MKHWFVNTEENLFTTETSTHCYTTSSRKKDVFMVTSAFVKLGKILILENFKAQRKK
jgi:hypothetical protein